MLRPGQAAGAPPASSCEILESAARVDGPAAALLYGFFGFISGLVVGTIYNFVAKLVGGLELEVL